MKIVAIILLVAGALILVYHGFTYTSRKKVLDIGSIQATKQEHHTVWIPPVLGGIAVVCGVVVLITERRN